MTEGTRVEARRCMFCGGTGLNREHVFPEWVRKLFPKSPDARQIVTHYDMPTGLPRLAHDRSSKSLFETVIRHACKGCNGGWMEDGRDVVRRLIIGERTLLRHDEQKQVARWAVKTAMTFDMTDRSTAVISDEHRRWLFEKLEPPPQTSVWIGTASGTNWTQGRSRHHAVSLEGVGDHPTHYLQSTAIGLGPLFLLVVGTDIPMLGINFKLGMLAPKLRRIWPVGQAIAFPIKATLDNETGEMASNLVFLIPPELLKTGVVRPMNS